MLKFLKALSILLGTIIGAGVFGLPYVMGKSGFIPGSFYFLILGGAVLLIHLLFGEVILRTKEPCRLPGLAQKYLGEKGKIFVMIPVVVGIIGALLAYLILGGEFLKILFGSFNLSSTYLTLIFGVILSYFVFRGVKLIASLELLTNIIFFLAIFLILVFCLPQFNFSNIGAFSVPHIFLPFGVILFSLIGWSAIPEIVDFLKLPQNKKQLKKVIVFGTLIIIPFYLAFVFIILGVVGENISSDTLSSLLPFLGTKIMFFGALAGLLTLADSFLVLALYLKNTFIYDLRIPQNLAGFFACGLPIILFLIGFRSFISVLGFVGTIVGVIEGMVIILIFKKAKKLGNRQPEYSLSVPSPLLYLLMAILVFGALSQFINR